MITNREVLNAGRKNGAEDPDEIKQLSESDVKGIIRNRFVELIGHHGERWRELHMYRTQFISFYGANLNGFHGTDTHMGHIEEFHNIYSDPDMQKALGELQRFIRENFSKHYIVDITFNKMKTLESVGNGLLILVQRRR